MASDVSSEGGCGDMWITPCQLRLGIEALNTPIYAILINDYGQLSADRLFSRLYRPMSQLLESRLHSMIQRRDFHD